MLIKTGDGRITHIIKSKDLTEEEKQSVDEAVAPVRKDKKASKPIPVKKAGS